MEEIVIQQMENLLKKVILSKIQNEVFDKKILLKYLRRKIPGLSFDNNKIYITALTSGHSGVAFTGETGPISVGSSTTSQMVVKAKFGYGSHIIYDSVIQSVKGNKGAIANAVYQLKEDLRTSFERELNRMLFGDGKGTLATITTGASSTNTHSVDNVRFLQIGKKVLIGTRSEIEGGTADLATVKSINAGGKTVTFEETITTADGDVIVTDGVYQNGEYQEITGLDALISNETENPGSFFQGIERATNDWANSYVDSTTATLTEDQIIDLVTNVNEIGDVNLIITTPELRNKYASYLQAQKRYSNSVDLKGGFKGLEILVGEKPIPLVADYDCPAGKLFALTTSTLALVELNPIGFLTSGSGGIMTEVYDSNGRRLPAYQTTMKFYGELVCTKPKANGKLTNKS